ncbi:MAG: hypothetical protein AB1586_24280 [Pseudomonadota bacterium]
MADSNAVAMLGLLLTGTGLAFGLMQYRSNSEQASLARRRERAVVATTQTRHFLADPDVRFVMELLDYGEVPFVDEALKSHSPFTKDRLVGALEVYWKGDKVAEGTSKPLMQPEDRAVRSAFDGFLNWLERIEVLIGNDVISVGGFGELFSYWLVLLTEIPGNEDKIVHLGDAERQAIWDYIRGYEYNLVARLFARYGRAGPVGIKSFKPRPATAGTVK